MQSNLCPGRAQLGQLQVDGRSLQDVSDQSTQHQYRINTRVLSLGQMLQPMRELLKSLGRTESMLGRLEELAGPDKLEALEKSWRETMERAPPAVKFDNVEEWS